MADPPETMYKFESKRVLPGEIRDDNLIRQNYNQLLKSWEVIIDKFKKDDPSNHYFRAVNGEWMKPQGGQEITITIGSGQDGNEIVIKYNSREAFDGEDPTALSHVNAISAIVTIGLADQTQNTDLHVFRDGNKHSFKANSRGADHEIDFFNNDMNSKDIADALEKIRKQSGELLLSPNTTIQALNEPPSIGGLVILPDPRDKGVQN